MERQPDSALLRIEPMQIYDYQHILHPVSSTTRVSDGEWESYGQDDDSCINEISKKDGPATEGDPMITRKAHKIFPFTLYTVRSFSHLLLYRNDDCVVLNLTDQCIYRQLSWVHHHMNNHRLGGHSFITSIQTLHLPYFTGLCIGDNSGTFTLYDLSLKHPGGKLMLSYCFHSSSLIQISTITTNYYKNNQKCDDTWLFLIYRDGVLSVIYLNRLLEYPSYPIPVEASPEQSFPKLLSSCYASCRLDHALHDDYIHKACLMNVKQNDEPENKELECLLICSHKEEYLFTMHRINVHSTQITDSEGVNSFSQWLNTNSAISSLQKFAQDIYQSVSPTIEKNSVSNAFTSIKASQISSYPEDGHRTIEGFFIPFNIIEQKSSFFQALPIAMPDNLGRVLLFDAVSGCILYIWKGYRHATCQWLCSSLEEGSQLYLAIYSPSRPQQCDVWKLPFDYKTSLLLPELVKSISLKNHEVVIPWSCTTINQYSLGSNEFEWPLVCSANHKFSHRAYDTLLLLHRNKGHIRHIGLTDIEK